MNFNSHFDNKSKGMLVVGGIVTVLSSLVLADETLQIFKGSLLGSVNYLFSNIYFFFIFILSLTSIICIFIILKLRSIIETYKFNDYKKKATFDAFLSFIIDFAFENNLTPKTTKTKQLDLFLTNILTSFPNNRCIHKIALAIPQEDGRFRIIHDKNIGDPQIRNIEMQANWKDEKSLFAYGYRRQKEDFKIYYNGDLDKHYLETIPNGKINYQISVAHMIIPLRDELYPKHKEDIEGCIGVLIISATNKKGLLKEKEKQYYNSIHPSLKSIEGVLLQYDYIKPRLM